MGKIESKDIDLIRGSKAELTASEFTYDSLRAFIDSSLVGSTVGDLIEHLEELIEQAKQEERVKTINEVIDFCNTIDYVDFGRESMEGLTVEIHSKKYKHYFFSPDGIGGAIREFFKDVK